MSTVGSDAGAAITRVATAPGRRSETGDITVEAVIAIPLLLLMVFACVQLSFNWFGRAALQTAAQDALSVYQTNSTGQRGFRDPGVVAQQSARRNAGFVASVTQTMETLPDGRVKVTVTGRVPVAFPGATMRIESSAIGTLDNFRPQGDT